MMRHGSLFSGIGGFDLAAEWMGWENIFHCEWNPFGQKILKHYWPNATSYTDITTTDFTIHRGGIDILTGGFPCQPYSTAGKRLGKEDERHLWPEMLRAIREIQPAWVVGENVLGIVSWNGGMVFDEVQADLEAEGYEVQPYVLPACAVNAPHRRDRVWFVAYSNKIRSRGRGTGCGREEENQTIRTNLQQQIDRLSYKWPTTNSECDRGAKGFSVRPSEQHYAYVEAGGATSDTNGGYELRNWVCQTNREGFIAGQNCSIDYWENFPTQSPICNGNDGVPARLDTSAISFSKWRNESIKAGGNAIVPQVAYQIFRAIEQYKKLFAA